MSYYVHMLAKDYHKHGIARSPGANPFRINNLQQEIKKIEKPNSDNFNQQELEDFLNDLFYPQDYDSRDVSHWFVEELNKLDFFNTKMVDAGNRWLQSCSQKGIVSMTATTNNPDADSSRLKTITKDTTIKEIQTLVAKINADFEEGSKFYNSVVSRKDFQGMLNKKKVILEKLTNLWKDYEGDDDISYHKFFQRIDHQRDKKGRYIKTAANNYVTLRELNELLHYGVYLSNTKMLGDMFELALGTAFQLFSKEIFGDSMNTVTKVMGDIKSVNNINSNALTPSLLKTTIDYSKVGSDLEKIVKSFTDSIDITEPAATGGQLVIKTKAPTQQKSDVSLFLEYPDQRVESIGVSAKNYSDPNKGIHLVSETPLFVLLQDTPETMYHFLNVTIGDGSHTSRDISEKNKKLITQSAMVSAIASALVGSKSSDKNANYLIVNSNKQRRITVKSIPDVIDEIMHNTIPSLQRQFDNTEKIANFHYSFAKDWVFGKNLSQEEKEKRGQERTLLALAMLHNTKITMSVKNLVD